MTSFLFWIGAYNIFGAIVTMTMSSEKLSDTILRKVTEIISEPYSHGPFGRMWLWMAASCNLFLGATMMLSTRWNTLAQQEVAFLCVVTYAILYAVMIMGGRKPKFGRGIHFTHVLWLGQMAWGIWVIITFIE